MILRVELPSREGAAGPPSLVVLRLDHLSYSGAHPLAGQTIWHAGSKAESMACLPCLTLVYHVCGTSLALGHVTAAVWSATDSLFTPYPGRGSMSVLDLS